MPIQLIIMMSSRKPITSEWISGGMYFNCIGADAPGKQELDPMIFKRALKIVIDDMKQAIHSGEINAPLSRDIIGKVPASMKAIVLDVFFARYSATTAPAAPVLIL